MKRDEIERLREAVCCQTVLDTSGFVLDAKESTKRAMKYRRGNEIIIVTHSGRGWFDPLSDEKGDVFRLMIHLQACSFLDGCARIASLARLEPSHRLRRSADHGRQAKPSIAENWERRRSPWPGSATWRYLSGHRCLPSSIISAAIAQDVLREGPCGTMWAAHTDDLGRICGWESRGPDWRGFAKGGDKVLFRLGSSKAFRICVTEAAIDAMSLAAIEGMRDGTVYLSTGGGWAPATAAALRSLAAGSDVQLVAATDGNSQGDAYAHRLRVMAEEVGCTWLRLRPHGDDWNELLKQRKGEKKGREEERGGVPHSRRLHQGRLRPAVPALDPAGKDAGGSEDVMED